MKTHVSSKELKLLVFRVMSIFNSSRLSSSDLDSLDSLERRFKGTGLPSKSKIKGVHHENETGSANNLIFRFQMPTVLLYYIL